MENKLRSIHVMASSDSGTHVQLTLSADTDDLRDLVSAAFVKIAQYSSASEEKLRIVHIDSLLRLSDPDSLNR